MILPQCQIFPISVPGVQNGHLGDHARFLRRLRVVVFFRDANGKHPRPVPGIVVRPKHFPRAFGVQFRFHEARSLPDVSIFNRRVLLLQRFNFFCLVLEENDREKKNHFKKPPKRNDDFEKPFSLGLFHRANEFSQLFFFVSLFVCNVFVVVFVVASAALVLGHLLLTSQLYLLKTLVFFSLGDD